jgi:Flp pilus assembly protein TadG
MSVGGPIRLPAGRQPGEGIVGNRVHRLRREGASTLVEFALIAPILLLLLFGILETARLVFSTTAVWTAAREGARFATTVDAAGGTPNYLDCAEIKAAARAKIVTRITDGAISVLYRDAAGSRVADCDLGPAPTAALVPSGSSVEVTVTGTYDAIVPIVGAFLDGVGLDSRQTRTIFVEEEVGGP